uniref:Taste receptor type 2 member 40 n=1 Tax=Crocodylus porosus TaxID=8502 RepID=A0A7M4FQ44_CROPO
FFQPLSYIFLLRAVCIIWVNTFIQAVNYINWVKNRCLNSSDKILTVLGISRLCFLSASALKIFCQAVLPRFFHLSCVSHAFSACFWLLSSSNFSQPCFIHLNLRITRQIPRLLLVSGLFSLVVNLPCFDNPYKMQCDLYVVNLFLFYSTGFSAAFTIFIISALLLLFSLWRRTALEDATQLQEPRRASYRFSSHFCVNKDFHKAFELVQHKILKKKLEHKISVHSMDYNHQASVFLLESCKDHYTSMHFQ